MQETICGRSRNIFRKTYKRQCADQGSGNIGKHTRDNVQIKEHDGEKEHVQETMCRRTGKFNIEKAC